METQGFVSPHFLSCGDESLHIGVDRKVIMSQKIQEIVLMIDFLIIFAMDSNIYKI